MEKSSKSIWIPAIIGLMINTISFYFFSLQGINFVTLLFILGASVMLMIIMGIQSKMDEITSELQEIKNKLKEKLEQKDLNEKLLIHDRLTKLEAILNGKKR